MIALNRKVQYNYNIDKNMGVRYELCRVYKRICKR